MAYYHGSPKRNIKTLQPRQPYLKSDPKGVYFSKEIFGPEVYALTPSREAKGLIINYNTSGRSFHGGHLISKGPINLQSKGYVYTAKSQKGIRSNPKATNQELYSTDPVRVAFHKEVDRQQVLARGWTIHEKQRFPNARALYEMVKTSYRIAKR